MSRRLIVMKFGGTSVGNAACFRQCAEIVSKAAQQDRVMVVVSAMAGVTDLIFKTIEAARHADTAVTVMHLQEFRQVHRELISNLFDPGRHPAALELVEHISEQLQAACQARLLPLLQRDAIPVAAGYGGCTADGRTATLGRGGSDYSATILGAASGADEVWIWTDVDGVLSADPRICPDATVLPEITFAEAIELAYYGAKVIHPKAAFPAMNAGFSVWIKNSFRPDAPGTRITRSTSCPINSPVKSVTCVKSATLITLVTRRDVHPVELWGRLFLRMGQEQTEDLFATQSSPEHQHGLVLRKEDSPAVLKMIQNIFRLELAQGVLAPVEVDNDVAVVAVLGESMKGKCGVLVRLFAAVAHQPVSVIAVAQGASELSICFAVPAASAADVVSAVHGERSEERRVGKEWR